MSNTKNNGGPAFPRQHDWGYGMTLRDYFAAKAMQALIEKYDESPVEISLEAGCVERLCIALIGDSNGS